MGLLSAFGGIRRSRNVTPAIPVKSTLVGQENYDNNYRHTNTRNFTGGYIPNPYRLHSSIIAQRDKDQYVSNAGIHRFVYEPSIQRVPDSTLQQQFNLKKLLPTVDVGVPANGVFVQATPRDTVERDVLSGYIPNEGRRTPIAAHSPVILLSTPINSFTNQVAKNQSLSSGNYGRAALKIVSPKDRKVPRGKAQ